jgi:hypothetical protein
MSSPELLYDRFIGLWVQRPTEAQITFGRWLVRAQDEASVFLNSVPVSGEQFLCAERSGAWSVVSETGDILDGRVSAHQQLDAMEAESIRTLGRHLSEQVNTDKTWLDWMTVVPLVPGMADDIDLLPLDQSICDLFGYLEAVCMKPRAHLNVEVERVPVSRARRLPGEAASYLAAHTEDWERLLLRGVLPKRVLSEVRHDEYDIYENRVAARLVDNLVTYLSGRIRRLSKLLKVFQEKADYSSESAGGTYLRRKRILCLWDKSIDEDKGRQRVEKTLSKLGCFRHKLMGLMDSPLYRELPRRGYVAPSLRSTNILSNDQDYRRVADLWRAWVDAGLAKIPTPAETHDEAQELGHGMDRFGMLLVIRALEQLGYEPQEKDWHAPVKPGGCWTVEAGATALTCEWCADGRVQLGLGDSRLIFVSLPSVLGAARSSEQLLPLLRDAENAANGHGQRLVLLYPDATAEGQTVSEPIIRRLHTIGNDPRTGQSDRVGVLPVSPWAIGSVERVSRAIRWFVEGTRYDAYPFEVEVPPDVRSIAPLGRLEWLEQRGDGKKMALRRPPLDYEWNELDLDVLVDRKGEEQMLAQLEHERISGQVRDADRKGVRKGALDKQKAAARSTLQNLERCVRSITKFRDELKVAQEQSQWLLRCPACRTQANPKTDFDVRDRDCFRCKCADCGAHWGTRLCSKGHRYAVMRPLGKFIDVEDTRAGWEDRVYGSDLLAVPARTNQGNWGFVCPVCGEVT